MKRLEAHAQSKEWVIWDWNGTLLDDLDLCVDAIGSQLRRHGLQPVSREVYREVFGFPVRHYYERLGFDFDAVPFETLSTGFMEAYGERVLSDARLFDGARELLATLQSAGIRQAVLSAAKQEHLEAQIDHFGIRGRFEGLYGIEDAFAAGKIERGRQMIRELGIDPARALLIGDTDHDVEVGRELGLEVLLLGDGHQHPERLRHRHSWVLDSRYV